jgi:putative ABC transport system permease protein
LFAPRKARPIVARLGGLVWKRNQFCRGWLITGDTGSGKTSSGINQLAHQVFQNEPTWGGLCVDEKGVYWETLAAKNLRENRNILNNISLLALSISSLILIFTISFTAIRQTIGFYSTARFELWTFVSQADRTLEPLIRSVKGVTDVNSAYTVNNVAVAGRTKRISQLEGINTRTYQDFWDLKIPRDLLSRLDEGRNILVTRALEDSLGVHIGDALTLELQEGKRAYTVIGFFDSVRNNGSFSIVSDKYLKMDAGLRWYGDIYVKTTLPPEEAQAAMKKKLERMRRWHRSRAFRPHR